MIKQAKNGLNKKQLIACDIKKQITEGLWRPGQRLPSLREQARRCKVSLLTAMHAYQILQDQGVIISREKSGYYVLSNLNSELKENKFTPDESNNVSLHKADSNEYIHQIIQQAAVVTAPFGSPFPDPDLLPHLKIKKSLASAIRDFDPLRHSTILPPGEEQLREKISQRYASSGVNFPADNIVITAGALDGLGLCLQAVTEPGDAVLIEEPCFYGVLQQISRLRLKAVPVKSSVFMGLDLTELESILSDTPAKAMVLMTNNQNPVGYTLTEPKKKQLAAILEKHKVIAIEDDVYHEIYPSDKRGKPLCSYFESDGWIYCSSFSKILSMDYRIGWVVSSCYGNKIQRLQLMNTISVSPIAQLTVNHFLTANGFEYNLRVFRRELELRKDFAWRKLKEYFPAEVKVHYISGGYFLWVEMPEYIDADDIYESAYKMNVSISPGRMFSVSGAYRNYFRFNASLQWSPLIDEGAKLLGAIIDTEIKEVAESRNS